MCVCVCVCVCVCFVLFQLTGHVAYLESTQGVLEVVSVADLSTVDQFAAVQKTLEVG